MGEGNILTIYLKFGDVNFDMRKDPIYIYGILNLSSHCRPFNYIAAVHVIVSLYHFTRSPWFVDFLRLLGAKQKHKSSFTVRVYGVLNLPSHCYHRLASQLYRFSPCNYTT